MSVHHKIKKTFWLLITVLALLACLALGAYFYLVRNFDNRFYPRVFIGNNNIGGLSLVEAKKELQVKVDNIFNPGFKFVYNGQVKIIDPKQNGLSIDVAAPLLDINLDETLDTAYKFGRSENISNDILSHFQALLFTKSVSLKYYLAIDRLNALLNDNFKDWEQAVRETSLKIEFNNNRPIVSVIPGVASAIIDRDLALNNLQAQINNLEPVVVNLKSRQVEPNIKADEVNVDLVQLQVEKILARTPFVLHYEDDLSTTTINLKIKKELLVNWIGLGRDNSGTVSATIDNVKINDWLQTRIASLTDYEPAPARFEIKNNRVSSFGVSRDGRKLNLELSANKIKDYLNGIATSSVVELTVDSVKSNYAATPSNNFQITEIIGTGHSNFVGSPKNRLQNIAVGSAAINGLLIAPGEEFSLVKALGNVDAASGYLPELVIKENRTIPEYGGGLCQVGTTLFRAAIESGLPVTSRRSHSYRVSYYEPAGMDAAVYIPNPDVKFINDTGNYILIQTRTVKNDLYFDFWGVKDDRKINITVPVVYNIVKPPAPKLLETLDLAPGVKKCTEHSHNGADAYFDYTVTYHPSSTDEKVAKQRFASHYVPWQEVCLIGVSQLSGATPNVNNGEATTTVPVN